MPAEASPGYRHFRAAPSLAATGAVNLDQGYYQTPKLTLHVVRHLLGLARGLAVRLYFQFGDL